MPFNIMETKRTDKELLSKGVQRLAITFILMFIGPVVIHSAFKNQTHPLYIFILILGIAISGTAIFMGFKAIRTMMDAFFGKKKKSTASRRKLDND